MSVSDQSGALTPHFPSLSQAGSPVVSRERFAELVGLPLGVIVGFINKGYLPTVTIGKYSLVNVEALRHKAAEKAQEFTL